MTGSPTPIYDSFRYIQEEMNDFFLGEKLGEGQYRCVYAHPLDPDNFVIKVQKENPEFCNQIEWVIWNTLLDTPAGQWLAPCQNISIRGNVLIQRRCSPIAKSQIPDKIPDFLTDAHPNNWGMFEGRAVMFDYGFLFGSMRGIVSKKKLKLIDREDA